LRKGLTYVQQLKLFFSVGWYTRTRVDGAKLQRRDTMVFCDGLHCIVLFHMVRTKYTAKLTILHHTVHAHVVVRVATKLK
jgi:hypothetical protein